MNSDKPWNKSNKLVPFKMATENPFFGALSILIEQVH